MPIIATEQYPKALGSTVTELKDVLPASASIIAKTRFSMITPEVHDLLKQKSVVSQVRFAAACMPAVRKRCITTTKLLTPPEAPPGIGCGTYLIGGAVPPVPGSRVLLR